MKKLLGVLLLVLVLVASSAALAEMDWDDFDEQWGWRNTFTAPFVPEGRIVPEQNDLLPFFKVSTTYEDGMLNIVIDDEQTDWAGLMSHGAGAPNINLSYVIKNPDPDKYHRAGDFPGGVYWDSEEAAKADIFRMILNYLQDEFGDCDPMEASDKLDNLEAEDYTNGHGIGKVAKDQSMLAPEGTNGYGVYLGWYNIQEMYYIWTNAENEEDFMQEAASKVYFEHVGMTITHTKDEAFYIPVKLVSEYSLAPSADISMQQFDGITFDTERFKAGEISFIVDSEKARPNENFGGEFNGETIQVHAFIRPPEHLEGVANEAFVYNERGRCEMLEVGDDGLLWISGDYNLGSNEVEERPFVVSWYQWRRAQEGEVPGEGEVLDEDGFIHTPLNEYGQFYFHIVPKDVKPWPAYVKADNEYSHGLDWKPVSPASRVTVVNSETEALPTYANITYNADTGILHAGFKADATISTDTADVKVIVAPPSNNKTWYYRTDREGGSSLMGKHQDKVRDMDQMCQNPDDFGGEIVWPKTGDFTVREYPLLEMVPAGPVDVYLQTEPVWEYGGGAQVIYWYNDPDAPADEPVLIEYICETYEELSFTMESDCVESEEEITEPVTQITGIGKHCRGWKLKIRYDLQRGHNAIHFDLHLEDEHGNHRQPEPGKPMVFYMPYPEGTGYMDDYHFDLRHYNADYSRDEKIEVVYTEYGLKFTVSSLSPFTLEWNDNTVPGVPGEVAPAVPPTGDNTPVMLLGMLMVVSLCGVVLAVRKPRAK